MRKKAILRTLAYADIFDYPLTTQELYRFLIAEKSISYSSLELDLKKLPQVFQKQGFYCAATNEWSEVYFFKGRGKIVPLRKKRERWSKKKLKIAKRAVGWLKLIPTVQMIAVTGALAMNNSDKGDDVDLLIVTSNNWLWLSRGLIVTILRFSGNYRRPGKVKDMICPNMLLDEEHLAVPKKEQDLFTAHEVCQLKLLWDKNKTYQKFVKENQWVKRFLPNWKP